MKKVPLILKERKALKIQKRRKKRKALKKNLDLGKIEVRAQSRKRSKNKNEIAQLEMDLLEIEYKIGNSENLKNMIQEDYYDKRERYRDAHIALEEIKSTKVRLKDQMADYMIMYEMKKEQTLKDLNKKLESTPGYMHENLLLNKD